MDNTAKNTLAKGRRGRPRTDPRYVELIGALAEEGLGPSAIARKMKEEAILTGRVDWPSHRTVARILARHRELPPGERRERALFGWPQAMMDGLVPWEASHAAVHYVRFCAMYLKARPTVRLVRWYWRVFLLEGPTPTSSEENVGNIQRRHLAAAVLATWEQERSGGMSISPEFDLYLTYTPWKGDAEAVRYKEALARLGSDQRSTVSPFEWDIPVFKISGGDRVPENVPEVFWRQLLLSPPHEGGVR